MQMFFLRNMMGIFIAAVIFTVIAIGVVVVRARTSAPDIAPQNEPTEMAPENDLDNSVPETPSDDFFDPMETPEQRVMEELEGLGVVSNDERAAAQPEDPANSQEAVVPDAPPPVTDVAPPPVTDVAPSPVPEAAPSPAPEEALPPSTEAAPPENNGAVGVNEVPISFQSKEVAIKSKLVTAALKLQEDEEGGKKKAPEDPNDPTSEGEGPGGRHKKGKVVNISSIPVIRMGEIPPEQGTFKVLKPLHS
jgi:hypothetical protein